MGPSVTATVSGALFDFIGYLTTRPEPVTLGSAHDAVPAVTLLQEWAKERGLNLDTADVKNWTLGL